jgi:hypothetical protein
MKPDPLERTLVLELGQWLPYVLLVDENDALVRWHDTFGNHSSCETGLPDRMIQGHRKHPSVSTLNRIS